MKRVVILEANSKEMVDSRHAAGGRLPTGLFTDVIRQYAPNIEVIPTEPYRGDFDAGILSEVDGAIFTGCGVAWSVDEPDGRLLAEACEEVFKAGLSTYGSCNGLQMAAHLLGGAVRYSPNGLEVGLAKNLSLTNAGRTHPMMAGRSDGFAVPCIHRDEVCKLPDGAELLVTNAHSQVQGFAYEGQGVSFWGVQYHPEYPADYIGEILGFIYAAGGGTDLELMRDMNAMEKDDAVASNHGTSSKAQRAETRTLEVQNWLHRIGAAA
ncbi:MAG: type 1 glutamine amidotransferase [Pseudomonadota bacterium]